MKFNQILCGAFILTSLSCGSTTTSTDVPATKAATDGSSEAPPAAAGVPENAVVFRFSQEPWVGVLVPVKLASYQWSTFNLTLRSGAVDGLITDPSYTVEVEEWMDMGAEGGHPGRRKSFNKSADGTYEWVIGFTMPGLWQIRLRLKSGAQVVDEVMQEIQVP